MHRYIVRVVFVGAHVSSSGGIHTAIDRAEAIGADSVQVFTQSPRAWRPTNHPPENFERFKERRAEAGIGGVLCHALYLVNLASPKDDFYEKSVAAMCNTVDVGCAIAAEGVVFHIGSHLGAGMEEGLERVVEAMKKRLGVCLDSCHLYVSGCDVTNEAALDSTLDELDGSIGLDRLRALHVNDSKTPLGSNLDRHDNVGEGLMGEKLGVFLGHPRLQGLPALLEVPGPDGHGPDASQIEKTKKLRDRWLSKGAASARRWA